MQDPLQREFTEFFEIETKDADPPAFPPKQIGRYRIEKLLAKGGFGLVYLAFDDQLERLVAIKVPHPHLAMKAEQVLEYLTEARNVAKLDHPHIVPVFDVGSTETFPCYIVTKFIDGVDLDARLAQARIPLLESVTLVATIADALHHAHSLGLVHRDIKPGNLLLDQTGQAFVTDFGLAMREQDVGKGVRFAGTPSYMSPEQARSEGHRVDCRSDIFSLGAVFYELLTGVRPFRGNTLDELLQQIADLDPVPPRQLDESIPAEIERVCLKALSKRASERHPTAKEFASDLRHYLRLNSPSSRSERDSAQEKVTPQEDPATFQLPNISDRPGSGLNAIKVVPKGLRSFDAHDASFFLDLLPGPRDRDGLPESLRFWKTRLEEMDSDETFPVGLIYGPSGCGKSSLVKAGLLPRLSDKVIAVYVEATAKETETRLLNGLRKRCTSLSHELTLKESLAVLRRGQGISSAKKVVIVLDQFEQWLHGWTNEETSEIVQVLRQCDGSHVQSLVMVRDDFWMAATRFMRELEVPLLEGKNSAAVDLFDPDHARKILSAFGRAFGKFPDAAADAQKEQKRFLNQAVSDLAQDGKVISVRLALFAEMMKGKTWTVATSKEVGGTAGVGCTFLEETFNAPTAPPEHRYHQKAARAILSALLPESGAEIKGHMRSYADLMHTSGYTHRDQEFDVVIRILDNEIRLITPTDPEGIESENIAPLMVETGERYYQLTHDYLVPSLRDWLTQKQKETRRGRAELLLADRASVWNSRQENRQLPSFWQWLSIRYLTHQANWTAPQRRMMSRADHLHRLRVMVAGMVCAIVLVVGLTIQERVITHSQQVYAQGLKNTILNAETSQVPAIVNDMAVHRKWVDPMLRDEFDRAEYRSARKLNASIALLPVQPEQVEYLYERLFDVHPEEVLVIRQVLSPQRSMLIDRLWQEAYAKPDQSRGSRRLRATAVLAEYDRDSSGWEDVKQSVVKELVSENSLHLKPWIDAFRPIRAKLVGPLKAVFQDAPKGGERTLATDILNDYAADNPLELADLLMGADDTQFAVIYPTFSAHAGEGISVLEAQIARVQTLNDPGVDEIEREVVAKRIVNAAVTLLRMGHSKHYWPLLEHSSDPRIRSYLIHWLPRLGAPPQLLCDPFNQKLEISIRRALLLCLGEFLDFDIPLDQPKVFLTKLRAVYENDPDAGLHAAAEWLLKQMHEEPWLESTNLRYCENKSEQEAALKRIIAKISAGIRIDDPQWYVAPHGQTMVVISGPREYLMGSPETDEYRNDDEQQHTRKINQTFALASTHVTVEQYQKFLKHRPLEYRPLEKFTRLPNLPAIGVNWHEAACYCNWLSAQEGIPEDQWCFEEIPGEAVTARRKENHLSLTGYRLPTEAEIEYATRARAKTVRFFGETIELLNKYAWVIENSHDQTWPVGTLKPNDFGLFDVHGNAWVWCQEPDIRSDADYGVLRCGSWYTRSIHVRSAARYHFPLKNKQDPFGFRVARTLPVNRSGAGE